MSDNQQRIRELAYQIWENQGRPEGKTEEHWALARKLVESENRGQMAETAEKPKRTRKTAPLDETQAEKPLLGKPGARKAAATAAPSVRKTRKPRDQ